MSTTDQLTDIEMPQMGESIAEAIISRWCKQVGDPVQRDETLLEISTAKVEADIPSPADGVLAEILFPEGETVPINTVICRLAPAGANIATAPAPASRSTPEKMPAASAPAPPSNGSSNRRPAAAPTGDAVQREREKLLGRRSTPLVRSICKELGIDISRVPGTGQSGRVTKADVIRFLSEQGGVEAAKAEMSPVARPAPAGQAAPRPAPRSDDALLDSIEFADGEDTVSRPLSPMRRIIADRMIESLRTNAHAYTIFEMDMTGVMRARTRLNEATPSATRITPLVVILHAVAKTLEEFPQLNTTFDGQRMTHHRRVNLGVAVAIPDGLIVPVIRDAQSLTVAELGDRLGDLANRARSKHLDPREVEEGTFTVTSPGKLGSLMGLSVLNSPQAGILHIGGIHKVPAVIEGPDGTDMIAIRQRAIFTLAIDHRVVDGWLSDSFMAALRTRLNRADSLLDQ